MSNPLALSVQHQVENSTVQSKRPWKTLSLALLGQEVFIYFYRCVQIVLPAAVKALAYEQDVKVGDDGKITQHGTERIRKRH